jgi:hypothetical protein
MKPRQCRGFLFFGESNPERPERSRRIEGLDQKALSVLSACPPLAESRRIETRVGTIKLFFRCALRHR